MSRAQAAAALRALCGISELFRPWLLASEIRAVKGDGLLLSPCAKDAVGFHFTWRRSQQEVLSRCLPDIERVLKPFGARPHWGKLFVTTRRGLEELYGPALRRFRRLAREMDPEGKFCNERPGGGLDLRGSI